MGNLKQKAKPEYGDGFWQVGWGSGKITYINHALRTVTVSYYEKGHRTYEFDHILGCYQRIHGGTWVIDDASAGE